MFNVVFLLSVSNVMFLLSVLQIYIKGLVSDIANKNDTILILNN